MTPLDAVLHALPPPPAPPTLPPPPEPPVEPPCWYIIRLVRRVFISCSLSSSLITHDFVIPMLSHFANLWHKANNMITELLHALLRNSMYLDIRSLERFVFNMNLSKEEKPYSIQALI